MKDNSERRTEDVLAKFKASLDRHGYGFQYRVLKAAEDLVREDISSIVFEVAEFPVEVQSYGTRVDFILRRTALRRLDIQSMLRGKRPLFLVAECKRANPALSDWCFLKAPFTRSGGLLNSIIVDAIKFGDGRFGASSRTMPLSRDDFYQIAIEVKSDKDGNPSGNGRGAI